MQTMQEILSENAWAGICGDFTDKSTTHNYIEGFYEKNFLPYRSSPIEILEIGIASGHSLLLWEKYFSTGSKIYGLDVEAKNIVKDVFLNSNIKVIINNAYHPFVADSMPNFDIIIDDGPHTLESMVFSLMLYMPKIKEGGLMVIEDIQDYQWFEILINVFNKYKKEHDVYEIVDLRETKNRYDDLMFVVKRK